MKLAIGDLRPALLDNDVLLIIDELRSFRHLFRNLYACLLDPERVRLVQAKVQPVAEAFFLAHEDYVGKLTTIAMNL